MKSLVCTALVLVLAAGCGGNPDPSAGGSRPAAPQAQDRSKDFGEYVLHFNALTTDLIPADTARAFGLSRSKSRAMLNIVMMRKVEGALDRPVAGTVRARTSNLTGQLKNLELRPVTEGDAIYYIGEIPVVNGEVLIFEIEATPEGTESTMEVKFQQQFFTR